MSITFWVGKPIAMHSGLQIRMLLGTRGFRRSIDPVRVAIVFACLSRISAAGFKMLTPQYGHHLSTAEADKFMRRPWLFEGALEQLVRPFLLACKIQCT
jgi:hypothetical protein